MAVHREKADTLLPLAMMSAQIIREQEILRINRMKGGTDGWT